MIIGVVAMIASCWHFMTVDQVTVIFGHFLTIIFSDDATLWGGDWLLFKKDDILHTNGVPSRGKADSLVMKPM